MFAWFRSWKERRDLKRLIRTMLPLLQKRYGRMEFYSKGQVFKTAELTRLAQSKPIGAIAMFVKPEEATEALQEMGSLESYDQIRRRLLDLSFKEYREDNFEENCFVCSEVSSDSGHGSGGYDSGGDSGSSHH